MKEREETASQKLDKRVLSTGFRLRATTYQTNGRVALEAWVDDGAFPECECRITINLVDEPLEDDEFHVRFEDRRLASSVFDGLIDDGIAKPTGKIVSTIYVEDYAEVWKLEGT